MHTLARHVLLAVIAVPILPFLIVAPVGAQSAAELAEQIRMYCSDFSGHEGK